MQNLERLALAEIQEFPAGSRSIALANQGREQIYRFVERVLAAQHYRRLGKEAEGHREAISSAAERVESGPVDAADGSVASAPTDRGPTTPPAPLSAPLHTPGHCLVSGRRRCPRGSVGAGGTAHPGVRVSVVWQLGVRPPGPNLGLHIHNLQPSRACRLHRVVLHRTPARQVAIAERRKPDPQGQPAICASIQCTVHQGPWDGRPGLYHVNTVDTVTCGTSSAASRRSRSGTWCRC